MKGSPAVAYGPIPPLCEKLRLLRYCAERTLGPGLLLTPPSQIHRSASHLPCVSSRRCGLISARLAWTYTICGNSSPLLSCTHFQASAADPQPDRQAPNTCCTRTIDLPRHFSGPSISSEQGDPRNLCGGFCELAVIKGREMTGFQGTLPADNGGSSRDWPSLRCRPMAGLRPRDQQEIATCRQSRPVTIAGLSVSCEQKSSPFPRP